MKYDDASWHSGDGFPEKSPAEYSGTHIALLLKWCFMRGWAGDLHMEENAEDVENVTSGKKSATEFFFQWCDGKFTDEDLNDEGNEFISKYYEKDYLNDYASLFAELMFEASEQEHDFEEFTRLINKRYTEYLPNKNSKPWWKLW